MSEASIRMRFVCEANPVSRTIAFLSEGHLSHVDAIDNGGMAWGERTDRVGGKPPGMQCRHPDYAKFTRVVMMEIPCTQLQHESFWAFHHSQENKPYDTEAIWGFAVNRTWHHPGYWFCSAIQVAAEQSVDLIEYELYLPPWKNTPVMCAQLNSSIKGVKWKEII